MRSSSTAALAAAIILLSGCRRDTLQAPPNEAPEQRSFGTLPGNVVTVLVATDEQRGVVQANTKEAHTVTYRMGLPKGKPQEIQNGEYLGLVGLPGKDQFFLVQHDQSTASFWLYDFDGRLLRHLSTAYKSDEPGVPYCQASSEIVLCAAEQPGMTQDSPDYDGLGFSAVQVADMKSGTITLIRHPGTKHFGYDSRKREILVSEVLNENSHEHDTLVFSLAGKLMGRRKGIRGTLMSPSGRYYLPHTHEYPLPWEVYDAQSNLPILKFNVSSEETMRGDYATPGEWNSKKENLLVVFKMHGQGDASTSNLEVYDLEKKSVIRKLPGSGFMGWTQGGDKLIFLRDREITLVQP
jgi:hypothetical protein